LTGKSTYSDLISLCIPATDPAESGFRPDPAGSIKPTHVHWRRFDSFGRILLDLSNRRKYTGVGLIDPAENRREIPPRVQFSPTVQISSTSVFNRRPERGRRMTKNSKREMVFFRERKKNDGFVLKRKKQEKKMLQTVSKKSSLNLEMVFKKLSGN
jgi:hypothetical protein